MIEVSKLALAAAKDVQTNPEYWNHIGNRCPCEGCIERTGSAIDKHFGSLIAENEANKNRVEKLSAESAATKSELEIVRANLEKAKAELTTFKNSLKDLSAKS
jgi:hypothetical protein